MEIETLRSFLIVARTGNLTRAAELLYVTQPTLSRRIAALEEELGRSLFIRERVGMTLTPAGEALRCEAESIVARVDALPHLVNSRLARGGEQSAASNELRGTVRVISQEMLDDNIARRFVARMSSACPGLDVQVSHAYPPQIRRALTQGTADIGFFLRPVSSSISSLLTYKVGESRVQLMVCDSHPFATRSSVDIHELAGHDFIMLDRRVSPEIVDFINSKCFAAGFSLNAVRYVTDAENGAVLVSAGRGMSFLHSMMRFQMPLESTGVRIVDIDGADFSIDYVARMRSGLAPELSDAMLDALGDIKCDQRALIHI